MDTSPPARSTFNNSVAKLPRETNLISSTKTERFSSPVLAYTIHVETRMHFMYVDSALSIKTCR